MWVVQDNLNFCVGRSVNMKGCCLKGWSEKFSFLVKLIAATSVTVS